MVSKEVVISNQVGLHARPATFFIQKANEYKCSIWVEKDERRVNAKSLLGVLSLGIVKGTPITIIADGSDEYGYILTKRAGNVNLFPGVLEKCTAKIPASTRCYFNSTTVTPVSPSP